MARQLTPEELAYLAGFKAGWRLAADETRHDVEDLINQLNGSCRRRK
jgi:hypothetical protein